jgi:hypothetical protein
MTDKELEAIKLHIAGATVQNISPFNILNSHSNDKELSNDFIEQWVTPFYMRIGDLDVDWVYQLKSIKNEISPAIIQKCLGDFNWRTRHTGAFFAVILEQPQYIDIIGTHFLKSEVCYAGRTYARVFAAFDTPKCVEYLNLYLDYYLTKPDLWFDQREAMESILYLDKVNSTNHFDRHLRNWSEFTKNKPNWKKDISTENLEKELNVIWTVKGIDS